MHKPPGRPSPSLLDFLVRRRFRSSTDLTKSLLAGVRQQQRPGASASVWKQHRDDQRGFRVFKGVHKGNFVRVKLPRAAAPSQQSWQHLGLLPSVMTFPPVLPTNVREKAAAMMAAATHPSDWRYYALRFQAWLYENYGTIAMNIGSICTLIGFTCTDVLELRTFSMCGSMGAILYNLAQTPLRVPPIAWSSTFASVNAFKIYQIRQERQAAVHLTAAEEETYNRFFLPHGVTPKQFETVYHKATPLEVAKDECILRKDDPLDHVYLIIDGTTKANIRGRHLTAASFSPEAHETKQGGASGAWVGEMAFLEQYWIKEQLKRQQAAAVKESESEMESSKDSKPTGTTAKRTITTTVKGGEDVPAKPAEPSAKQLVAPGNAPPVVAKKATALYTIVAKDDCRILRWSHEEMEELLAKSTDLRASMTRAMTQAIVGKTINFIVSKSSGVPTWSAWLDDWRYSSASDIKVQNMQPGQTTLGLPEDDSLEQAPVIRGIVTRDTVPEMN